MLNKFQQMFEIKELRDKFIFTALILLIYRVGAHIPIPGINAKELANYFATQGNSMLDLYNMFSGGAFKKATVFALGIMPYISASIVMQLLGAVYAPIKKLQMEGAEGRKTITQWTRYGTVGLSIIQAFGISIFLRSIKDFDILMINPVFFTVVAVITLTTGTLIIMWLGERITEKGIGNGISILIFVGIIARFPTAIYQEVKKVAMGVTSPFVMLAVAVFLVGITMFVVMLTLGVRKIPIHSQKRVVGNKVTGGQNTYLPIKVNSVGVLPIIFASSFLIVPQTLGSFFPNVEAVQSMVSYFSPGSFVYMLGFSLLIIFFTYLYTAIQFNPYDIAENLRKQGAFIPGYRAGQWTAEYLDKVLSRLTLPGSMALAAVAIVPQIVAYGLNLSFFMGGTTLLIAVGVSLDTAQQVEGFLLMKHYDGIMSSGKIRGRRG